MLHTLVKSDDPNKVNVLAVPDDPDKPCVIQSYNRVDLRLEGEIEKPRAEGLKMAAEYAEEREKEQVAFEIERRLDPTLPQNTKGPLEQDEELLNKIVPNRSAERLTLMVKGNPHLEPGREGVQEKVTLDGQKPNEAEFISSLDGKEQYSLRFTRSAAFAQAAEYAYAKEREKTNDKNKQNDPERQKDEERLKNLRQSDPKMLAEGCKDVAALAAQLDWLKRKCEIAAQEEQRLEQMAKNPLRAFFGGIQAQMQHAQNDMQYFGRERSSAGEAALKMASERKVSERTEQINQKQAPGRTETAKALKQIQSKVSDKYFENKRFGHKEDTLEEEVDARAKKKDKNRGIEMELTREPPR